MIFTLTPIHRMSQTTFYPVKHLYIRYDQLSHPLLFNAHVHGQPNMNTSLTLIQEILQSQH